MALVEKDTAQKRGPSALVQAGLVIGLTALTAGVGWLAGTYLQGRSTPDTKPATQEQTEGQDGEAKNSRIAAPHILALEPITTNLSNPADTWVRAELSLVFDGAPNPEMAQEIHQDLFAYLRTVRLQQVESASGFQQLRADMVERARIRSDDAVTNILFQTLLFE